jgi:AraC-like DNA-binding protein
MHTSITDMRDLPPKDRFDAWRELITTTVVPVDVSTDHASDFGATAAMTTVADVVVHRLTYPSLRAQRTRRHIAGMDPGFYHVAFSEGGKTRLTQDRTDVALHPGQMSLFSSSHPFESANWGDDAAGTPCATMIMLPRHVIPLPERALRDLSLAPMSCSEGLGGLSLQLAHELSANAARYQPLEATRLGHLISDAVTATLAHELGVHTPLSPQSQDALMFARVQAYITASLDDPDLSLPTIAAAHFISVRTLHQMFSDRGLRPWEWIKTVRLEKCCRDLRDPTLSHLTIVAIAKRSGFASSPSFSRAFTDALGVSPSIYREQTHTTP